MDKKNLPLSKIGRNVANDFVKLLPPQGNKSHYVAS